MSEELVAKFNGLFADLKQEGYDIIFWANKSDENNLAINVGGPNSASEDLAVITALSDISTSWKNHREGKT